MKKILFSILGCLLLHYVGFGQSFSVEGDLTGVTEPARVDLVFNGQTLTVLTKNGKFKFTGETMPTDATLRIMLHHPTLDMEKDPGYWEEFLKNQEMWGTRSVFLEGKVHVQGKTVNDARVTGTKNQKVYEAYRTNFEALSSALAELREQNNTDEEEEDSAPKVHEPNPEELSIRKEMQDLKLAFIKQHPDSYFSLELVNQEIGSDPIVLAEMLSFLGSSLQQESRYKNLVSMVEGAKNNQIGDQALDFVLNSNKDTPLALADLKGNYVLIDFWASWCGPCRAENPNLLRVYNSFKADNFEILGVSLDKNHASWKNAIQEDNLPWLQVIDKEGRDAVSLQYAVKAIPQNYLIDPAGKVVAKDLKANELEALLEGLFRKNK